MSKREQAKAHLRLGYYQNLSDSTRVWVRCPVCRDSVATTVVAWATPTDRSAALVAALDIHLTDEH